MNTEVTRRESMEDAGRRESLEREGRLVYGTAEDIISCIEDELGSRKSRKLATAVFEVLSSNHPTMGGYVERVGGCLAYTIPDWGTFWHIVMNSR